MATFNKDGFTFFNGFFGEPVLNFDNIEINNKIDYIKSNNLKNISLDNSLTDFSFIKEINFIEEVYLNANLNVEDLYHLKDLKRLIVNIEKGEPNIQYSKFRSLEYLSIDWYSKFPDLSNNHKLKALVIWKFKPKSKSLSELRLPENLENLEITEANINNIEGINLTNLKKFEMNYCNALKSLEGIKNIGSSLEVLILENCKKLAQYDDIEHCKLLEKIILTNCGDIPSLKWLSMLKKIKHFSFWNTKLTDGDTSPCFGIDYVAFMNAKHYNHKETEFKN